MPSSTENLVSTVQIRPPAPAEAEGHSHAELLGTSLELVHRSFVGTVVMQVTVGGRFDPTT
ncbi:hypothetical protein BDA96_01G545500 [Sorghum bicolor]|uniref:Uncharacterized protein n=1 Tax=Sorghum bicolor TaxID=4558 RepID=A0A921S6Z9_SORBI|nr:hypothetical protein BDA96_01G545500 [Sorghum bicolor]